MCTDLNQCPVIALQLYCARARIETMFDMLKNLIGAFHYHFWSKVMPKHSRKPKKNKDLKPPPAQDIHSIGVCWEAYERFVMLGAIALGLLQMIALKYGGCVWRSFDGFLRTKSRDLPSERTVKYVIARLLVKNFLLSAPKAIMLEIRQWYFRERFKAKPA
jgi:hypothetical protein